jgi:hypothetical protein
MVDPARKRKAPKRTLAVVLGIVVVVVGYLLLSPNVRFARASASSHLDFRIDGCEFDPCVVDPHLPIDAFLSAVHVA